MTRMLSIAIAGWLLAGTAAASETTSADAIAMAEQELAAVKQAKYEWQLIDKATGSASVPLTKLLEAAKKARAEGQEDEALRIAKRVLEAAKLGQQQAQEQSSAKPQYPQ